MQIATHLNFEEICQLRLGGRVIETMKHIVQATLRFLVTWILLGTGRKQHHYR